MKASKWFFLALVALVAVAGCHRRPTRAAQLKRGDELLAQKKYLDATMAYYAASVNGPPDVRLFQQVVDAGLKAPPSLYLVDAAGRLADMKPNDVDAQIQAASLMVAMRSYDKVLHRLEKVVADNPNQPAALIVMANARARLASSIVALTLGIAARTPEEFAAVPRRARPGATAISSAGNTRAADIQAEALFRRAIAVDSSAPQPQIALANFLWATDRARECESVLKGLADQHPEETVANLALGRYYVLTNRPEDAQRYLKAAVATSTLPDPGESRPAAAHARNAFADLYLHAGTSEQEQNKLGFLNFFGDSRDAIVAARFALADLYLRTNRDDDALAVLTAVPRSHRSHAAVRIASAEFRSGEYEQASTRLDEALQLEAAPEAKLLKAQLLVVLHRPADALHLARDAAKATPNSDVARATLGDVLFATGDLENALDELHEATQLNVTAGEAYVQLARVNLALGRGKDAVIAAREGARLKAGDRDATLTLIRALVAAGDPTTADLRLQPLLAREPGAADLLAQLGAVQAARGTDDAARAAFTKALQRDPNSADALSGLVSLDLKQNQTDTARKRVDAALAAHPKDVHIMQIAARVYAAGNDTQRLDEVSRTMVQLDPTDVSAALAMSNGRAQPEETQRVLEALLQRRPRALEARFALGTLLERTGHADEARKQYEAMLAEPARPDNERIRSRAMARKQAL
jgi:tetratricopeptide (TPR) repeat protein